MKILSPQTTGEAWPPPGRGVRQITFSVALHCVGTAFSRLVPSSRGPRHVGQFSACRRGWVRAPASVAKSSAGRNARRPVLPAGAVDDFRAKIRWRENVVTVGKPVSP